MSYSYILYTSSTKTYPLYPSNAIAICRLWYHLLKRLVEIYTTNMIAYISCYIYIFTLYYDKIFLNIESLPQVPTTFFLPLELCVSKIDIIIKLKLIYFSLKIKYKITHDFFFFFFTSIVVFLYSQCVNVNSFIGRVLIRHDTYKARATNQLQ